MKRLFVIVLVILMVAPAFAADKAVTIGGARNNYPIVNSTTYTSDSDYSLPSLAYVNKRPVAITCQIEDVSTAQSDWVVSPVAGTITKIYTVIDATITGDAALTTEIGGTAVTGAALTIASGSGAGTVDSSTPTALNTVTAGQAIECITDGGSTNTSKATVTIWVTPSDS